MFAGARSILTTTAVLVTTVPLLPGSEALAQLPGCSNDGNRLLRSAVGATLGAWTGLVAMKIRNSDWNDASRSTTGIRQLNRGVVVGAVIGVSLGNLRFRSACQHRGIATTAPRNPMRSSISAEEIRKSGLNGNTYDLVFTLRRQWLNLRGIELSETPRVVVGERSATVTAANNPTLVVYLDNAKVGDQEVLKNIPIDGVIEVRFHDAAQATYRWGSGHNHGAIQVLTIPTSQP